MKKIICKKEYDTEHATLITTHMYGAYGEPTSYEETLYQAPAGLYFLHVRGGEDSPYPHEDILRLAKLKVNEWLQNYDPHSAHHTPANSKVHDTGNNQNSKVLIKDLRN